MKMISIFEEIVNAISAIYTDTTMSQFGKPICLPAKVYYFPSEDISLP